MIKDRLPPHSIEDELGLLGCILQDSQDCLIEISSKISADSFYDLRNKNVFRVIADMNSRNVPIDLGTLFSEMRTTGSLEAAGGMVHLNEIDAYRLPIGLLDYYADKVSEDEIRRMIIRSCADLSESASDEKDFDSLMASVNALMQLEKPGATEVMDGSQASAKMIDDLEARFKLQGKLSGLDTGFTQLNNLTDGFQFGEQALIGGRPSQGKTALGLNVFQKTVFSNIPSIFVSLEMSVQALMRRMLSNETNIPMNEVRKGSYTQSQFGKFAVFKSRCSKAPMFIIDAVKGLNITNLSALVRRTARKHGAKLVVIDYLQKIKSSHKHEKKTYEIGETSGSLKSLAVETNCAFVTMAQLSRENEKDKGRIPRMSDLADSAQIERDADTVMLLHRDKSKGPNEASLFVAKQRDGETGMVDLNFNGAFCRFEEPQNQWRTQTNDH